MSNKQSQYQLQYNVKIKPRGYGKSYQIKQEMEQLQWLTNVNEKNKLKKS